MTRVIRAWAMKTRFVRARSSGRGYPRHPPLPPVTPAEVTLHLILTKFSQPFTLRSRNRVHINALARLIGTTLGVASVTCCVHIKQLLDEVEHDIMNYQNLVSVLSAEAEG